MNLLIRSKDGRLELAEIEAEDDVITFVEDIEDMLDRNAISIDEAIDRINDFNATSKEVSIRATIKPKLKLELELDHSKTLRLIERKLQLLKSLTRGMK